MNDQQMIKADFVTAILLLVFSLTILILSIQMPRMQQLGANPYSAPGIVPGFLGAIIFLLSAILCIRSVRRQGYRLNLSGASITQFFQDEAIRRVLLTILLSLVYGIGFLGNIPYIVATFVYVASFIIIFEYQKGVPWHAQKKMLILALLQALLVTGAVALVFRYLFLVKLP